jgi:hypothetical protein
VGSDRLGGEPADPVRLAEPVGDGLQDGVGYRRIGLDYVHVVEKRFGDVSSSLVVEDDGGHSQRIETAEVPFLRRVGHSTNGGSATDSVAVPDQSCLVRLPKHPIERRPRAVESLHEVPFRGPALTEGLEALAPPEEQPTQFVHGPLTHRSERAVHVNERRGQRWFGCHR